MGSPLRLKMILYKEPSLLTFSEKVLTPYLYNFCHRIQHLFKWIQTRDTEKRSKKHSTKNTARKSKLAYKVKKPRTTACLLGRIT